MPGLIWFGLIEFCWTFFCLFLAEVLNIKNVLYVPKMLWFCIDNKSRLSSLFSKIDALNKCYCKGFCNHNCGFCTS